MFTFIRTNAGMLVIALLLCVLGSEASLSQTRKAKKVASVPTGRAVMWEPTDPRHLDLYNGPGGEEMRPDLSRIEFIKKETGGHSKKYRIRDGSGRIWVAKIGREARPETAAVRLLYGLGYKTEINYLVPRLTIPGKGTFTNVRLEARPDNVERLEEWKWQSNPFVGTRELQGLKMMMVFMTNWDVVDIQNKVIRVGDEDHYIVSDLGATFGKLGNNNLPIIYRLGRRTGNPRVYSKTNFVRRVRGNEVQLSYKGKNRKIFKGITVADARWLANRLRRLSDDQIRDVFRAANYSEAEVNLYTQTVRNKIAELDRAVGSNLALN